MYMGIMVKGYFPSLWEFYICVMAGLCMHGHICLWSKSSQKAGLKFMIVVKQLKFF